MKKKRFRMMVILWLIGTIILQSIPVHAQNDEIGLRSSSSSFQYSVFELRNMAEWQKVIGVTVNEEEYQKASEKSALSQGKKYYMPDAGFLEPKVYISKLKKDDIVKFITAQGYLQAKVNNPDGMFGIHDKKSVKFVVKPKDSKPEETTEPTEPEITLKVKAVFFDFVVEVLPAPKAGEVQGIEINGEPYEKGNFKYSHWNNPKRYYLENGDLYLFEPAEGAVLTLTYANEKKYSFKYLKSEKKFDLLKKSDPQQPNPSQPQPSDPQQPNPGQPQPSDPQQPNPSQPQPSDPQQPNPSQPQPSDPQQPNPSQPQPSDPQQPNPSQPQPSDPQQPNPSQPQPSDPQQPNPSQPQPSDPQQPNPSQPQPSDPQQPNPSQPQPSDPQQPNPGQPQPSDPQQPNPSQPQPSNPQQPNPSQPQPSDPQQPNPSQPQPSDPQQPNPSQPQPSDPQQPNPNASVPALTPYVPAVETETRPIVPYAVAKEEIKQPEIKKEDDTTTGTEVLTENQIPEGVVTETQNTPATISGKMVAAEEIKETPLPLGAPELPKTAGIPAELLCLFGLGAAFVGFWLKRQK